MGIFSRLFRSRDHPKNATAGSAYRFYLGGSTSGKAVTERSAMQMTAVYSCVRILAEAIAELTFTLFDTRKNSVNKSLQQFCSAEGSLFLYVYFLLFRDFARGDLNQFDGKSKGMRNNQKCHSLLEVDFTMRERQKDIAQIR